MTRMSLTEYQEIIGKNPNHGPRKNQRNTGESLQQLIDYTNDQYLLNKIAHIHFVEQPVRIETRQGSKVIGTLKKSTVDYMGIWNGKGVSFVAKSTLITTSFPLSNIEEHQYEFLHSYSENGGISFLIIGFMSLNQFFILSFRHLQLSKENKPLD